MHSAIHNLEQYVEQVTKALRGGKLKKGEEIEEVYDHAKMVKLVDELKKVLLPHLEAEEASLRGPVVKEAGFQLNEIKSLIR